MRLEQAILDRLEKRNGQIAQLQSTVHALERAADVEREHARQQLAQQKNEIYGLQQLRNEKTAINEQLAEQITTARLEREQMQHQIAELRTESDRIREISKSLVPKSALKQAVQEAAELHAEVSKLVEENKKLVAQTEDSEVAERRERLIKSLNDEITKRDHELRAHEKELAEQREEIRKLMDGHAEDMKAQAELLNKYESLLTKITDLGSYAMTLGRKEGEPLEMFMGRQALRLAALEMQLKLATCNELDKLKAKLAPLDCLYKTLKGWQENDHIIGYGLTIDVAINKATEALSQLTA